MAKVDPREATGRPGPVRTSSGTRAAIRLAPVAADVTSQPRANDVQPAPFPEVPVRPEMPTRELDIDELRAMALRCASDVGADAPAPPRAPVPAPPPPRLELVLIDEPDDVQVPRSARSRGLGAAVVVLLALAIGVVAALAAYGVLR